MTMPSGSLEFRSVCGGFLSIYLHFMYKRCVKKASMRINTLKLRNRADGVMVGLLLFLLYFGNLIHQCGDVELNPGPPKLDTMRQTRLSNVRGNSSERQKGDSVAGASANAAGEPTLRDVMGALSNMNSKFDDMKQEMKHISDLFCAMQEEMSELKQENVDLRSKCEELDNANTALADEVARQEKKLDDLENRSRRNNILIRGIGRSENETWQNCEEAVRELFTDQLELAEDVVFERVHRLNQKEDSPIIACCSLYKQKEEIMKARSKLADTGYSISDDHSFRVRDIRKKLYPHLKSAKEAGKKAKMVYDHLVIESKKYVLDGDNIKPLAAR